MTNHPRNLPVQSTKELEPIPTEIIEDYAQSEYSEIANYSTHFAMLTPTQRRVLIAFLDDFVSEDMRTDTEMADDLGVDRKTIYNCKTNPRFGLALQQIMPELVKTKLPKYLSTIEDHGQKDWKALQFLMEYAGLWAKTTRNLNLTAQIGAEQGQSGSPGAVMERQVEIFRGIGYTLDRYIEEFTEVWRRREDEGG